MGMEHHHQPRQPRGTPVGGQFAGKANPEADGVELSTPSPTHVDEVRNNLRELIDRRAEALRQQGFLAAEVAPNLVSPRSTGHLAEWWDQHMAIAEYPPGDNGYPQMPDGWTPSQTTGHSLKGLRRTHRMAYVGGEVSIRMPSVAAIKSFANALVPGKAPGDTFDVPVTADFPGGEVSGWVRVVPTKDGTWATQSLGFSPQQAAYVAESVQCVLESRHPAMALRQAGDLLERRRQRAAQLGVAAEQVRSSWLHKMAYDDNTGTMIVTTGTGPDDERQYGYAVTAETFRRVKTSPAPGKVFNRFIRGRAPRVEVVACGKCGRYSASPAGHRCPPKPSPRFSWLPDNRLVQRHIFGGTDRFADA